MPSHSDRTWLNNVFERQKDAGIRHQSKCGRRVVFGPPKASDRYTAEELAAMGLVGVYAEDDGNG